MILSQMHPTIANSEHRTEVQCLVREGAISRLAITSTSLIEGQQEQHAPSALLRIVEVGEDKSRNNMLSTISGEEGVTPNASQRRLWAVM